MQSNMMSHVYNLMRPLILFMQYRVKMYEDSFIQITLTKWTRKAKRAALLLSQITFDKS